jgi:hypothetical protein
MRKILIVLVIAGLVVLAVTVPALAARPASAVGNAQGYDIAGNLRTTMVSAHALPGGGATGVVRVVKSSNTILIDVRDLVVEDNWAYIIGVVQSDTLPGSGNAVGLWVYLAVYDGSAVGDVDLVTYLDADTEAWVRADLAARTHFEPFQVPVTKGDYKLWP